MRVLYAFIADLVPHLTPPLRLFLFSRIAALPFHRYDHHTLQVHLMLYEQEIMYKLELVLLSTIAFFSSPVCQSLLFVPFLTLFLHHCVSDRV